MVIALGTFCLCLAIILGVYWAFVVLPEDQASRALRRRLRGTTGADRPPRRVLMKKDVPLSAVKALDAALARSGHLLDPLKRSIAISGWSVTVGIALLATAFLAVTAFAIVNLMVSSGWLALMAALLAGSTPFLVLRRAARKRLKKFEEQLPRAVDMIAVSLRAGHAFPTGVLMVAQDLEEPLGAEFRLMYDQQNYGKPLPDVLREFADRVPLLDARIFVTAVLTQRETGGNLAEVLDKLGNVIRDRFRLRRQVRSMSAHGRVTGLVLTALPPVLAALLYLIAPAYMRSMIDDSLGRQLVAVAVTLQIAGTLAIRRIVNIEF